MGLIESLPEGPVAVARTPDAIQMAAALARGCGSFLTNYRRLPNLPNLAILQLRDHA